MLETKRKENKVKYDELKVKLSQMQSTGGSMMQSPKGSALHESIFERNRPQVMKHITDPYAARPRGKSLFNEIQKQTLSLINGNEEGKTTTDYS